MLISNKLSFYSDLQLIIAFIKETSNFCFEQTSSKCLV